MRILLAGTGKIGETIVKHLCKEGHTVVVIDRSADVIEQIINTYDVMGIVGNVMSYDILQSAGIANCDLFISVTQTDESNMLACHIAKKYGAKYTIARVRDYEYSKQSNMMKEDLGISMTVNPEFLCAEEINRIINFPEALRVDTFSNELADMVEFQIPEGASVIGKELSDLSRELDKKVLVAAVERNGEVIIPNGQFKLCAKDKIHVVSDRLYARSLLSKLGFSSSKTKNVFIIGGGHTATYLAEGLIHDKYNVKIVEKDQERCQKISEFLPKANVIFADGSDQRVLDEEGMESSDIVACVTGSDEENIIISMYAKTRNIRKVITKINKKSYSELMEKVELSSIISPQEICASNIISYVRAISNDRGSNVKTLYKLVDEKLEAVEFEAGESSQLIGKMLKELKLKKDILIAGIVRKGEVIIPSGDTAIMAKDSVLVVTTGESLNDLDDILL